MPLKRLSDDSQQLPCLVCRVFDGRSAQQFPAALLCDPKERYLVDPASSHMLVSKIKPCMSKYKPH